MVPTEKSERPSMVTVGTMVRGVTYRIRIPTSPAGRGGGREGAEGIQRKKQTVAYLLVLRGCLLEQQELHYLIYR